MDGENVYTPEYLALLVERAREMADIALRERALGELTAPYAGIILRTLADFAEQTIAHPSTGSNP